MVVLALCTGRSGGDPDPGFRVLGMLLGMVRRGSRGKAPEEGMPGSRGWVAGHKRGWRGQEQPGVPLPARTTKGVAPMGRSARPGDRLLLASSQF